MGTFFTGYPQAAKGIYGVATGVTTTLGLCMPYGYQGKARDMWAMLWLK